MPQIRRLEWCTSAAILFLLSACAPPLTRAQVTPSPLAPIPTATTPASATTSALKGDSASGAKLFAQLPCSSCHDVTHPFPGGEVGPNLGNIVTESARILKSAEYRGTATDAAGYVRESIVDPNVYIVPGAVYHTGDGKSVMESDFAQILTPQQIDDLVAFLMTLK